MTFEELKRKAMAAWEALETKPRIDTAVSPQVKVVLRHAGCLDPASLEQYVASGGYGGLDKALKMAPEQVIEEIEKSGLRGRGGAGFPTGRKWRVCREAAGDEKYVIGNAHESDPASGSGRALLEGDPYAVLEGMLIAACAVDAKQGYLYIRSDYESAIARLKNALEQMGKNGLLGDNILGSKFGCRIEIVPAPGDFVCGEETVVLRSMEGKRAMAYPRPPFPASSGLHGQPTVINNVETLAHVAAILSGQYKNTKILVLAGSVKRPGPVEVPLGTTLRQIIFDIGGGMPEGKKFKAVQVGGPTGGWLPESSLDTPFDYEPLAEAGAIIGSGSLVVVDDSACLVDQTLKGFDFLTAESCGLCVVCREGTAQVREMLADIADGKGKADDLVLLQELGDGLRLGSLCGLGRTAANPLLSTIKYFRDEYEAHVSNKRCPAGVCKKLAGA